MVVVFIVYKLNSPNLPEHTEVNPPIKMPMYTKGDFNVEVSIELGEEEPGKKSINLTGNSNLNIDITTGKIIVEKLLLNGPEIKVPESNIITTPIEIYLNSAYPSTGEINLDTREIDISLDLIIDFAIKKGNSKFNPVEINMSIPLSGTINKESGIIKLSGEATIPPEKLSIPLPVNIHVIATTNPESNPELNVSNNQETR
jgi:hypothetical protein